MLGKNKALIIWLLSGCLLIFAMVVIGGITRLTHSGLSITEWNVIMGTLPPLNDEEWKLAFEKYKQFPEYKYINHTMVLSEFRYIFMWEYIHRLLGRIIGIVFIFPFFYFILKKNLDKKIIKKLLLIFFMGAFQGFLGWFMVKSGLQENPHVSHYRLAAHLITAFITFGVLFHTLLEVLEPAPADKNDKILLPAEKKKMYQTAWFFFALVTIQIVYGAFVAGLKAGTVYNTFPMMGDSWIAPAVYSLSPWWKNLIENMAGVQFVHRLIAWILFFTGIYLFYLSFKSSVKNLKQKGIWLFSILLIQILLGIFTLLFAVPVLLGVLHQATAFLLFSVSILYIYRTKALKTT